MNDDTLTGQVIAAAYQVHNTLGGGFLEKVYENALRVELEFSGIEVAQQYPVPVRYRDELVGDFFADLLVANKVVVEIKAVRKLAPEHEVQLVNYLGGTGIEIGLLINFGSSVEVKRKYRTYRPGTRNSENS